MQRTIPILHVGSYEQAKAWYVDWLGFAIDWEFRLEPGFPVYMQVSRDGLLLHLSEHKGDNPDGVRCNVDVDNLDALMSEWKARRPDFAQEAEITPWNAKHIELRKSLIHLLMFAEVSIPLLITLFLEVNSLVTLEMIIAFFLHEATALWDVSYAVTARQVTPNEQHVDSFLEMIPFIAIASVVALHWGQFLALWGVGQEKASFSVVWKEQPQLLKSPHCCR